jgi:ABC-type sugar transport system ATPase subunit
VVADGGMRKRSREVLAELGVGIQSVNVSVKGMSGGQRQCLAIARALIWGRRIVILDEPTAALGVRESAQVLELITRLKEHGVSVILVSHNMQQLVQVADRVTVMRLGRSVAVRDVADITPQTIVGLITGALPADVATPEDTASVVH